MTTPSSIGRDEELRFGFGRNWHTFLRSVDEARVQEAEQALAAMLEIPDLEGRSFVDVGSGSGLSSLAARRLGATVRSFDYDPDSVSCTLAMRERFSPGDPDWVVERGSALDRSYLHSIGTFDIVYSWGVLHHTGDMWQALGNVVPLVRPGGRLFVSVYNDPGPSTEVWTSVKRLYNRSGTAGRTLLLAAGAGWYGATGALRRLAPRRAQRTNTAASPGRGMTRWVDLVDWVGGFPYEAARPEEVFDFYRRRGFVLDRMVTCGSRHGCNEFVFTREGS